jgi:hypothetical protein
MMIDAETWSPGNWQNDRSRCFSAPVDNITAVVVLQCWAVSCWVELWSSRQRGCILIDAVAARGLVGLGRRFHDHTECDYHNRYCFDAAAAAAAAATTTTRLLVLCGRLDSNFIFRAVPATTTPPVWWPTSRGWPRCFGKGRTDKEHQKHPAVEKNMLRDALYR